MMCPDYQDEPSITYGVSFLNQTGNCVTCGRGMCSHVAAMLLSLNKIVPPERAILTDLIAELRSPGLDAYQSRLEADRAEARLREIEGEHR